MIEKNLYFAMRNILNCLILVFLFSTALAQPNPKTEKWREDIDFLRKELPLRHLDLYHNTPKSEFDRGFDELHRRIPVLADHEIIIELSRITALIGDGHSGFRLYSDLKEPLRSYPIRFYQYADGVFIQKIESRFAKFLGARLIKIGKYKTEDAIRMVTPLISRDNEMWIKFYAPYFLASPEILHALKIIDDMNSADYQFEVNGHTEVLSLSPNGNLYLDGHAQTDKGLEGIDLVDSKRDSSPLPLWLKGDPEDNYWFEYLSASKTVYFRYNNVQDKDGESLENFADRMFAFIEKTDVERFVIDMRWNRGGDNKLSRPILLGIIRSKKIDKRGKLFLITGRRTFSAAQYFVNELESYTNTIRVGEPTASRVNPYGDTYKIVLPNSGITVRASFVKFQQMGPWDFRKWAAPDIFTELSSTDYRDGVDPALDAIFDFKPGKPIDRLMKAAIEGDGMDAALAVYDRFINDKKNRYADTEEQLYNLGFELVAEQKFEQAEGIFSLNTKHFPDRFVSYYGLGECFEQTNRLTLARDNYEKSYKLAFKQNDDRTAVQIREKYDSVVKKLNASND